MVEKIFFKKPVVPALCAGVTASAVFYLFYGLHIPPFFSLLGAVGTAFAAFLIKQKRVRRFLIFSAVGWVAACTASVRLAKFVKSPETLLPLSDAASVTVELTGEPKPASKYYVLDCVLHAVQDKAGNYFSARGNAKLFFPKAVIDQNLAGGISLVKSKRAFPPDSGTAPCTVFASGAVINVCAKFSASENGVDCFFAENDVPVFIRWRSPLFRFRGSLRFRLMRLLFSWGAAGALLSALISADKNFLAPAVSASFIECGLAHVLALSGMHVSIVGGTGEKLFKPLAGKKLTSFISLALIGAFVWFAGAAPSLNRALGMSAILIAGKLLGVQASVPSTLCGMFLLHLLLKPQEAVTLGFMLSYGALAGILLFGEALTALGEGKIPHAILSPFAASFGAQAFTMPIVALTIGRITLIGLLSSSLVSPLIAVFLVFGLFSVFAAALFRPLAPLLGALLNLVYREIMGIVDALSGLLCFQVSGIFTAVLYTIVPIALGLFCLYAQNKILQRRIQLGTFNI